MRAEFEDVWVLTGPTGSGKTRLALQWAESADAEIVSMDSMALYRGMDVGTAKPTPEERARVPHHLLDVLDPWESSSVAWWLKEAARVCAEIRGRGKRILFVGGTPLYLKGMIFGMFEGPSADDALRARLLKESPETLHRRLSTVDPVAAQRLHPNDVRRTVRALEVFELTGRPISAWQQQWPAQALPPDEKRIVWLDLPRAVLHERIAQRVEAMFAHGWIEEVQRLRALPKPLSREASQALGYPEIGDYLDGRTDLAGAKERVLFRTRQFAKRQITWFRRLPGCFPSTGELTGPLWHRTMSEG